MASRTIVIYSGPAGSHYYEIAIQYVAFLRDKGLTARMVETRGALDNLERLVSENGPAVGFAQSGIERVADDGDRLAGLTGLASVAFEPLWVFVRDGDAIESMKELAGKRIAAGPPGSGTRAVTVLLLGDNGIESDVEIASFHDFTDAVMAAELVGGKIDAIFAVGQARTDVIEALFEVDALATLSLPHAAAYAQRHPDLEELVLSARTIDMARGVPRADVNLVTPTAVLVGNEHLHPAVVGILLEAAREIHRPASLFAPQETFPNTRNVSLPLSPAAVTYFARGQNVLFRSLPFRLAAIVGWLVVLLTPFATAAVFLFKVVPTLIQAPFEIRLRGLYRRLERIEKAPPHADTDRLHAELAEIDRESIGLKVPWSSEPSFFGFRQAVRDVRASVSAAPRGTD